MKIDFNIWWHRIIIVFVVALVISVGMFFIKEKPFSDEARERAQVEDEDHLHPSGIIDEHEHNGEVVEVVEPEDHEHEPETPEEHEHDE